MIDQVILPKLLEQLAQPSIFSLLDQVIIIPVQGVDQVQELDD